MAVPQNCEVAARTPPLVGPTRATAWRVSLASIEVSKNRIHGSNASSLRQCPSVADENPENIRTTSMMDDRNARNLTLLRKSSIAVLLPRFFVARFAESIQSSAVDVRWCGLMIPSFPQSTEIGFWRSCCAKLLSVWELPAGMFENPGCLGR